MSTFTHYPGVGRRVIWNRTPSQTLVIPAKAGIRFVDLKRRVVWGLDSRFRGNDRGLMRA